jgi:hypothetical protein
MHTNQIAVNKKLTDLKYAEMPPLASGRKSVSSFGPEESKAENMPRTVCQQPAATPQKGMYFIPEDCNDKCWLR